MKTTPLVLILFLTATSLWAQTPAAPMTPAQIQRMRMQMEMRNRAMSNNPAGATPAPGLSAPPAGASAPAVPATSPIYSTTPSGATASAPADGGTPEKEAAGYSYNFPGVDVNQVLDVYANLVGRTLLRANLPNASIVLKTQTPLTKTEAIEALQAVLALNGIVVVNIGEKFVKVLTPDAAGGAGGTLDSTDAAHLPDLGTYVTHICQLKYVKPSVMKASSSPSADCQTASPRLMTTASSSSATTPKTSSACWR